MKIAVIEDQEALAKALKKGLESEENEVDLFFTATSAKDKLEYSGSLYDLVILDLMLPDGDGADVCRDLRSTGVRSPILVLTARDATEDKVNLLDRGADDFMTKPFEFEELLARGRALARRSTPLEEELIVGDIRLVPGTRKVYRTGKELALTPSEFELLSYLMRSPGRAIGRDELLTKALKQKDLRPTNVLDVHIRNLRRKVDDHHVTKHIQTIHGVGYTFAN